MDGSSMVSIGEAAKAVGLSRRTIERWVRDEQLVVHPSGRDRRQRLVDLAEVQRLAVSRVRRLFASTEGSGASPMVVATEPTDEELADRVLHYVHTADVRIAAQLSFAEIEELRLTPEQLRSGPLARSLEILFGVARGERPWPRRAVLDTLDLVLELLFLPPGTDDYQIPGRFWNTHVGRRLMTAKARVFASADLVTESDAAALLGVPVSLVLRWLDERVLDFVYLNGSGRLMVVRCEVDRIRSLVEQVGEVPDRSVLTKVG